MSGVRFQIFCFFDHFNVQRKSSELRFLPTVKCPSMIDESVFSQNAQVFKLIHDSEFYWAKSAFYFWLKHKIKIIFGIIVNQKFWKHKQKNTPAPLPCPLSSMMVNNNIQRGGAASDPRVKFHEHMLWLKFSEWGAPITQVMIIKIKINISNLIKGSVDFYVIIWVNTTVIVFVRE